MTVINQWTKKPMEELEANYDCKEMSLDDVVNILNMQNKYIDLADRYIETANRVIRNLEEQIEILHRKKDTNE